jgi:GT2 family glycosyltransferase
LTAPKYDLALVIDCQGGTEQIFLLHRLLSAVDASNFPKRHLTIISGNNGWANSPEDNSTRLSGIDYAIQLGSEYVVYSDTDVVPPPDWWSKMKEVFDSDPSVGVVVVNVLGRFSEINVPERGTYFGFPKIPYTRQIWEGFTGVRAQFWTEAHDWNKEVGSWTRALATKLWVQHNKEERSVA